MADHPQPLVVHQGREERWEKIAYLELLYEYLKADNSIEEADYKLVISYIKNWIIKILKKIKSPEFIKRVKVLESKLG